MRADWMASGACTSGSTAHPRGATRRASGGAATMSTPTKARARAEAEGTLPMERAMTDQQIAGHDDWIAARGRFPARKKGFRRLREEGVPIRRRERRRDSGAPLWRPQPAHRISLHVRAGLGHRMQERLLLGGRLQRNYSPSQRARHVAGRHLTGTTGEIAGSGKALRLDVQVGLLRWQRFHS